MPAEPRPLQQLRRLAFERAGNVEAIPADWPALASALVRARRRLDPPPGPDDPILLLAVSARAAITTSPPGPAAGYKTIAERLEQDQPVTARELYLFAWEAVHGLRTTTADRPAARWLYAAERSLDAAVSLDVVPSATARALATWQHHLAQPLADPATLWATVATQRVILREAASTIASAVNEGLLAEDAATTIHEQLQAASAALRLTAAAPTAPSPASMMLGQVGADLVAARIEPTPARLSALLASHFGQIGLTARLVDARQALAAADRLETITIQWIAGRLTPPPTPVPDANAAAEPATDPAPPAQARAYQPVDAVAANLTDEECATRAQWRDLGHLAERAMAGDRAALAELGNDADLPALVDQGRRGVAELVLAMTPNISHQVGRAATDQQEDFRADLQLALMGAAETFDPGAGRWYTYANHWVARATPRYDGAGLPVPRRRRAVLAARDDLHGRLHRPATREEIAAAAGVSEQHAVRTQMLVTAGQLDPDHAPATESAEEAYLNAAEAAALQDSISRLHRDSRHAIKARLDGLSISGIAEQTQTSPATVRRRIDDGIDQLRKELAPTARTLDDRLDELRTVTLKRAAQHPDMGRPQPPIQPVIPLESGRSGPAI